MINRLHFSIEIAAERSRIWKAIWEEDSYRAWASVFYEGSYIVVENWEVGSTVHFLGPDQAGIYSQIVKHEPNQIIQFKHIGSVVKGKEQAIDEETKKWSGATEIYRLKEGDNGIILEAELDVMDEHLEYMTQTFPLALEKIKSNCLN